MPLEVFMARLEQPGPVEGDPAYGKELEQNDL